MSIRTDPQEMNEIAREVFAPLYPVMARQIRDKFGILSGFCIDIGSGPASLSIAMARITDLHVYALDVLPEMEPVAQANVDEAFLSDRITPVTADVCEMPMGDNSIDLVISRGSMFFWDDRPRAFREIYRVLKPGGVAYCGGGFGNELIKQQINDKFQSTEKLRERRKAWHKMKETHFSQITTDILREELAQAGITGEVLRENAGMFVEFHKQPS